MYIAHGETVTNEPVPNLGIIKGVGHRAFFKDLITKMLQNGQCRTSWVGNRKTNKPAPKGWLAV